MRKLSPVVNLYLRSFIIFLPVFLILYGVDPYGMGSVHLYSNPFGVLESEQWLQESPIQYFVGFIFNLFLKNDIFTHYLVIALGFLFLYLSMFLYDKKFQNEIEILKVFYFTPFFLIIFYWMGKPDTYLIASFLLLITYKENFTISLLATVFLVFSHIYISIIYISLSLFLNIVKFKPHNYFNFIFSILLYSFYRMNLEEFTGRYDVISSEIERALYSSFTNLLSGIISLFMWLWIPIILSSVFKNKKILFSFLAILIVSFFTLDHTRIFVISSIPIILYLTRSQLFIDRFNEILNKKQIYILGIFQIQKRGDLKIVDGRGLLEFDIFKEVLNKVIFQIEQIKNFF